jgi:hypothetical protein
LPKSEEEPGSHVVREVIEQIEQLHRTIAIRRLEPQVALVEGALARCLRDLRAIVAHEVRVQAERGPLLRIV